MSRILSGSVAADCQAWHVPEVESGQSGNQPMTARQLEEIQEQARQEGFQQGLGEGREAGMQVLRERIDLLEQVVQSLDGPLQKLDDAVEQQLVQLAMLVARQLVRRELKVDPGQVVGVVREALAALPIAARNVQLALHPEDAEMVREVLSLHEEEQSIHIIDDPVQDRGGCKVLTSTSQIDASVESRLNAVIANVLGGLRQSDGSED
ncbi:MAG TPA: flagellar assembly protein FliH [Gammaproteobacteria bacterium]|nr:flagellar assembly protein FliH [Gammaproteobacteria bacterium]